MQAYSVAALLLVIAIVSFSGAEAGRCQTCSCLMMSSERCLNGGTCRMSHGTAICACGVHWSGNRCQDVRVPSLRRNTENPCLPNPCQNSGFCMPGVPSFRCICSNGFTGTTCAAVDASYVDPCSGITCAPGFRCRAWSIGHFHSCVPN
ncbi:neurogenic locus notch homolog protein 4-like [Asterias amurensis]|uniref:neurogenic locus notch homolog protein 4-like n=1 Tax=Asterias amurensis TaxID=7602 RepID=UPI003AB8523D